MNMLQELEKGLEEEKRRVLELETKLKEMTLENESLKLEVSHMKTYRKETTDKIDKVKDKLKCPVCLEIPRSGPVLVCQNGHLECSKCSMRRSSPSCASCRVEGGGGKSLLAATLIENIEHDCMFDDCEECFDIDKVADHEKICLHRTVSCPNPKCKVKVTVAELMDHLIQGTCFLENKPLQIENAQSVKYELNLPCLKIGSCEVYLLQLDGANFGLIAQKLFTFYSFSVVLFGPKEECLQYKVTVDPVFEKSDVSSTFAGPPCSIDDDGDIKFGGLVMNKVNFEKLTGDSDIFGLNVTITKN